MRSRLLRLAVLLAVLAGGFALASAMAFSAPPAATWRVVAYAPLIVQDSAGAQPAATIAQAATETPTATDTPTATNTPTARTATLKLT